MVEAQHRSATLVLVDSLEEQAVLEELVDGVKPTRPDGREFEGLHYLLATPFRHPPLRHGSRFGSWTERGIWYGAALERTALAEVAYYRLLFLAGSAATLGPIRSEHTGFAVGIATRTGIDLTSAPFARFAARLEAKDSYAASQPLGSAMRQDGIEAFRFRSARDPHSGVCFGVFSPRAFQSKSPRASSLRVWHCTASPELVVLQRRGVLRPQQLAFARAVFLIDGELPRVRVG